MYSRTPKSKPVSNFARLLRLARRHAADGTIHDDLIPFFNQDGEWDLVAWGWPTSVHKAICKLMRGAHLPEDRRIERCPDGWRLRTSFVWWADDAIELPWAEVVGTVRILGHASVAAPKLRLVGSHLYMPYTPPLLDCPRLGEIIGDLYLYGAWKVHLPKLHYVGGDLRVAGFDLPSLETVGGSAEYRWHAELQLPNLRSVGGDLVDAYSTAVSAPNLQRIGGDLKICWEEVSMVEFRSLKHVGGSFLAGRAKSVAVPWLRKVRGSFRAESATSVDARRLRKVGGDLLTPFADDLFDWSLEVGGTRKYSPIAEKKREAGLRARKVLMEEKPMFL